jgi:hypothetical protein
VSCSPKNDAIYFWRTTTAELLNHYISFGGAMSVKQNRSNNQPSLGLRPFDRLTLGLIGLGVIFASLGLGEAVYRLAFLDFDGATDRLPIEMLFGLAFAWMTTKVAKRIYQYRMEASARINLIWDRNHKIRHAVESMAPVPYPGHQQAIRVIREEVDRIEWALTDILPR